MTILRIPLFFVVLSFLAACSSLPLPAEVDLKARLGDDASGRAEAPVGASPAQDLRTTLPDGGACVDFSDVSFPVTLESAQLHWNVDVDYDGPDLTGTVRARLFVAGEGEELFAPSHALGPSQTLKLDRTSTRFAGTAKLDPDQVRAVNDRLVCWGVRVRGEDVGAEESGTATIRYDVRDLRLRITFSVF